MYLTAKNLKFCFLISEVLLPHFCSVYLTAKDLKFCFLISALCTWLPKIWSSASSFLLYVLDCQRSEVLLPHFCSMYLTAKDFKFRICIASLPQLPNIFWSYASSTTLMEFFISTQYCRISLPNNDEIEASARISRACPDYKVWCSAGDCTRLNKMTLSLPQPHLRFYYSCILDRISLNPIGAGKCCLTWRGERQLLCMYDDFDVIADLSVSFSHQFPPNVSTLTYKRGAESNISW